VCTLLHVATNLLRRCRTGIPVPVDYSDAWQQVEVTAPEKGVSSWYRVRALKWHAVVHESAPQAGVVLR